MRTLLGLCLVFPLLGQVAPGVQCTVNVATTPTVRAEGLSEQIGDIVINCTGKLPPSAGGMNLSIFLNTPVSNPFDSKGLTDALLLIDEPAKTLQKLGDSVVQGSLHGNNSVTWFGVAIDPPVTSNRSIFRITNVRANASIPGAGSSLTPSQIIALVRASTGTGQEIQISSPQGAVANVLSGLTFKVLQPGTFNDCRPQNQGVFPGTTATRVDPQFLLRFRENFQTAFRTRILPSCDGTFPANGLCTSETGFFNSDPSFSPLPRPAAGTLLQARFLHVPNFTTVFVGSEAQAASGIAARLISQNTPVSVKSRDGTGIAQIPVSNGTATAVWEVLSSSPQAVENFDFGVWYATTSGGTTTTSPSVGPYGVAGGFAPAADRFLTIPRFISRPDSRLYPQLAISPTNVLYPFVTNYLGFDTGLLISNTSTDPFGTYNPAPGEHPMVEVTNCTTTGPNLKIVNPGGPTFNYYGGPGYVSLAQGYLGAILGQQGALSGLSVTASGSTGPSGSGNWLTAELDTTTTPTTTVLHVHPEGVPNGNSTNRVLVTASNGQTASFPVTLTVDTTSPVFERAGVTHAANYVPGYVSPGQAVVIFGLRFGPSTLAGLTLNPDGSTATLIGGTRVFFDGVAAPMIYAATGQVSCFVPFGVEGKSATKMVVEYNGVKSPEVTVPVVPNNPSLLTADASGAGQVAAFNQDYSLNSAANPAARGDYVFLYGTGAGQTSPPGRDGHIAAAPLPTLNFPLQVSIDGIDAEIQYQGPAPSLVEGVFQVNVKVPAGARPGPNVPIVLTQHGAQSQFGNTIAVK